jgi:hypothetical protein
MNETHTEAWSQYIYSTTWHCTLQHDYVPDSFQTADELYNHLEAVHREVSQSRELLALAQKSKVLEPRKADICPLCNESITQLTDHSVPVAYLEHDESGDTVASMTSEKKPSERTKTRRVGFANLNDLEGLDDKAKSKDLRIQSIQTPENPSGSSALRLKMAKHVAGHLKSLSFLSLRGVEQDVEDDASASHNAVHAVDEGGSGSDVERVTFGLDEPLLFDDISERRLLMDEEEQKENREADFSLERPHDDPNWSFVVCTQPVKRSLVSCLNKGLYINHPAAEKLGPR